VGAASRNPWARSAGAQPEQQMVEWFMVVFAGGGVRTWSQAMNGSRRRSATTDAAGTGIVARKGKPPDTAG